MKSRVHLKDKDNRKDILYFDIDLNFWQRLRLGLAIIRKFDISFMVGQAKVLKEGDRG